MSEAFQSQANPPPQQAPDDDAQYLTCGIDNEIFAIPVVHVREVLDLVPFTRVPNLPPSVRGMIDVRGKGVPVVDLRAKFGLTPTEPTESTRIVVLEIDIDGNPLVIGAMTDRVYEVTSLSAGGIEPPPAVGVRWQSDIIRGIGRRNNDFVIILNLNKVFTLTDLGASSVASVG